MLEHQGDHLGRQINLDTYLTAYNKIIPNEARIYMLQQFIGKKILGKFW